MTDIRIGFIGCGEVASTFALAMIQNKARVLVTDTLLEKQGGEAILRCRLGDAPVEIGALSQVVSQSDIILSTVTTQVAVRAAEAAIPHLKSGQVYVDLNSTSPSIKIQIASLMQMAEIDFVEGAILGAVGATGARTQLLLTGPRGKEVAAILNAVGLNCIVFGRNYGDSASFKMLRSVFSKGVECLLLEMLTAGQRAGIAQALMDDIVDLMTKIPFDQAAENWIKTHAVAHERRYHEMTQVVETLNELNVDPIMSAAARNFFKRSINLGFAEAFPEKPESAETVVEYLARQGEENPKYETREP